MKEIVGNINLIKEKKRGYSQENLNKELIDNILKLQLEKVIFNNSHYKRELVQLVIN